MPRKKAEKLSPIPEPKPRQAGRQVKATVTLEAAPDLSHISENIRSLAVPIGDIAFMVGNAMKHPEEQIENIRGILRQFGQVEPLVVNRRPVPAEVIGGNGRLQAMLAEGWQYVAVNYVDLTKAKANALSLALNEATKGRKWDRDLLDALLRDVDTGGDEQIGSMLSKLAEEQKLIPRDNSEPDLPKDPELETQPARITCPSCGYQFDGTIRVSEEAA